VVSRAAASAYATADTGPNAVLFDPVSIHDLLGSELINFSALTIRS